MKKLPGGKQSTDSMIHALRGHWTKLSQIARILQCSEKEAHVKLDSFAKNNEACTLFVRDGNSDPRILLVPRGEWKHLLKLLRSFPDD